MISEPCIYAGKPPSSRQEWIEVEALLTGAHLEGIVGDSAAMREVIRSVERFAPYDQTVLIKGESGTGKELVARALHRHGARSKGPFITVNCSNLVTSLAESLLFGHVRGAFTHAREPSVGYFRQAEGGTILLDEVAELPLQVQSKLLRAVEVLEVQPVGSSEVFRVDARLVAATNRDLRAMVKAGEFRQDLFFRLGGITIKLPRLCERRSDIPALAAHFVDRYNRAFGKRIEFISRVALELMLAYGWPGNVRELAHSVERAVLFSENDRIDVDDLPDDLKIFALSAPPASDNSSSSPFETDDTRDRMIAENELDVAMKRAVERSLRAARGNTAKAAEMLGISRPAIYRRMNRYGIGKSRLPARRER